jgi:uncharacterized Zn ribbon protein
MMLCPRCNAEMTNTTCGNYYCQKCGMVVNDLVLRDYKGTADIDIEKITPNSPVDKPIGMVGWICPKCNRGIAPFVKVCPCTNYTSTVTVNGTTLKSGTYVNKIPDENIQEVLDGKVLQTQTLTPLTSKIDNSEYIRATSNATAIEKIDPLTSKL